MASENEMDALRRAAESEMRREAPRGALGENNSKRRRVGGDDVEDNANDDDGSGDDNGGGPSQQQPWLRFAYSGASSLEGESTLGFVVSSMIRKERSAAREATGVLCSLLGVPEAEEEDEEEEEEEEVEVEEDGKGEEEENHKGEKKEKKKPSVPRLTPTLSPVKLGARGLSLLVYRGKSKRFEPGAAARCVEELVRSVLSAREERERKEEERRGKGRGRGEGGEVKAAEDGDAGATAAKAAEKAETAAFKTPLSFVRRVVPVDAAVVEGGEKTSGEGEQKQQQQQQQLPVLERLTAATRALVAAVDLESFLLEKKTDGGDDESEKEKKKDISNRGIKFAVSYRRHVPSEQEEQEEEQQQQQQQQEAKGGGEKERGGGSGNGGGAGGAAAAAAAPGPPSAGLACRAAVTRAVAEALAASISSAASSAAFGHAPASVDLRSPDVVCCVEVLPLSLGGPGGLSGRLAATLALVPGRCCDGQLRVRGVSEEDWRQSRRARKKKAGR